MMGDNMKQARKAIRNALKQEHAATQFNALRMFCIEQAHELDGDSWCMVCHRWMKDDDPRTYDVDGIICKRCEPDTGAPEPMGDMK